MGLTLARASTGTASRSRSSRARRATARWPRSSSGAAKPTAPTRRRRSSRRCATRRKAEGRFARYDGRWRDRDPAEAPPGVAPVIRIKAPKDGETVIQDHVQGRVAFPNKDLDDFIMLRSDGTPTYMHAVVVDDHDMGVTHVIRGDDHLTNAGRQTIIYEAMGWPVPEWAHHPADPRTGRREALQAPRRARRRSLPRHGLSAGGAQELSRAARLVARRRRDFLQRAGSGVVRSRRHQQGPPRASTSTSCRSVNGHYMRETPMMPMLLKRLEAILPEIEGGPDFAAAARRRRPRPDHRR